MGAPVDMIQREEMLKVFDGYGDITVGALGSHSALQILKGAKDEGFKTLAICKSGREKVYQRFRVADEVLTFKDYSELVEEKMLRQLREKNCVLVPHGSLIAYLGVDNIEDKLRIPLLGARGMLRWEADRRMMRRWLESAGVKMPLEVKDPKEIKGLSIVKFQGPRGGRGYFLASNYAEFEHKSREMLRRKRITAADLKRAIVQQYIHGVNMYISYFYSPISNEVEIFGMDRRYEANVDGLARIPAADQAKNYIEPSYVVVGNTPLVAREALLGRALEMGDEVVRVSKELVHPGMIGPFCLETMATHDLEFIAFEISARIVAGTNPYMDGSPYSYLLHGANVSMGRRIAMELKRGLREGEAELLIT